MLSQTNKTSQINKMYEKIMTPKLNKMVDTIDKIVIQNKNDTKTKEIKEVEACFTLLGHDMNSICNDNTHDGYRLKFYQCMDCSH